MMLHSDCGVGYSYDGPLAYSVDGGLTWREDNDGTGPLGPSGQRDCRQDSCRPLPNGMVGSNGTIFVAVKGGGDKAWVSYDGHAWTSVSWDGSDPIQPIVVLPRGVQLLSSYSAAVSTGSPTP